MGAPTAVMAAYAASKAADAAFDALPKHLESTDPAAFALAEDAHIGAFYHALAQTPVSWDDFVALLDVASADGLCAIEEDRAADLLSHAKRLLAAGGH